MASGRTMPTGWARAGSAGTPRAAPAHRQRLSTVLQVPRGSYAFMELLFLFGGDGDPPGTAIVDPTCLDDATLDFVVDEMNADPKAIGKLPHGELVRALQACGRDVIAISNPPDHRQRERQSARAAQALLIQGLDDLFIGEIARQVPYHVDDLGCVAQPLCERPW
jgi:hypothetical protein